MPLIHFRPRLKAAGVHFAISVAVVSLVALVIFTYWYPAPFASAAGAARLFTLLVAVDIILGPALTLIVVSPLKPKGELARDLSVIAIIQLGALCFGIYSVALARPVAIVFEFDQFRLVTAADVEEEALKLAPTRFQSLSWSGPTQLAVSRPASAAEQLRVIDLELNGFPIGAMPKYWHEYSVSADSAWQAGRPVSTLLGKYPSSTVAIDRLATRAGKPVSELRFLPLRTAHGEWVTLVAEPQARIIGHLPLDGFF